MMNRIAKNTATFKLGSGNTKKDSKRNGRRRARRLLNRIKN